MLANNDIYPPINLSFQKLDGEKSYAKITSSFNVIKQQNLSTWKCNYDGIINIKEFQGMISRVNVEVTFPDDHCDTTIDDNKLQNRSKN